MPSISSNLGRQRVVDESVTCPPALELEKSSVRPMKSQFKNDLSSLDHKKRVVRPMKSRSRNEYLKKSRSNGNGEYCCSLDVIEEHKEDLRKPVSLAMFPMFPGNIDNQCQESKGVTFRIKQRMRRKYRCRYVEKIENGQRSKKNSISADIVPVVAEQSTNISSLSEAPFSNDLEPQLKSEHKRRKYRSRHLEKNGKGPRCKENSTSNDTVPVLDEELTDSSSTRTIVSDLSSVSVSSCPSTRSIGSESSTGNLSSLGSTGSLSSWDQVVYSPQANLLRRFFLLAAAVIIAQWTLAHRASGSIYDGPSYARQHQLDIPVQLRRRRIADAASNVHLALHVLTNKADDLP